MASEGVERTRRVKRLLEDERWWAAAGLLGDVVAAVSVAAGVSETQMRGGRPQVRTPPVIAARRAVCVLGRLARMTHPQIARAVGMSTSGVMGAHSDAMALLAGRDSRNIPLPAGTFEEDAEHLLTVLERAAAVVLDKADERVRRGTKAPNSK